MDGRSQSDAVLDQIRPTLRDWSDVSRIEQIAVRPVRKTGHCAPSIDWLGSCPLLLVALCVVELRISRN